MANENAHDTFVILGFSENDGIYWIDKKGNWHYNKEEAKPRSDGSQEYAMRFDFVARHLKWLQKEVLTVVEATADKDKLPAIKELIKDKFSAKISWIYEQSGLAATQESALPDPEEE